MSADDLVLEIGAGTGRITGSLSRVAGNVVAVELDPGFAATLRRRVRTPTVEIVESDFLRVPLPEAPFRAFGNVPFGLTTAILRRLLDDPASPLSRADLIVQFEVARKRTTIWPSNFLTLGWLPWWEFNVLRHLPPSAFDPAPSVHGALLSITRRTPALLPPGRRGDFVRLLRTGFQREHLPVHRSLRLPERAWRRLARDRGIGSSARAGELDVFDWVAVFTLAQGRRLPS